MSIQNYNDLVDDATQNMKNIELMNKNQIKQLVGYNEVTKLSNSAIRIIAEYYNLPFEHVERCCRNFTGKSCDFNRFGQFLTHGSLPEMKIFHDDFGIQFQIPPAKFLSGFPDRPFYWMSDLKTLNYIRENIDPASYYIMNNGKIVKDFEKFIRKYSGQHLVKFSFHFRIRAGKGGFGSLLRSFRVNKSTNKLMMRDLNGRRLASIDEETRLKKYLEKQARKEQEQREKRKLKLAKLTAGPAKHQFEDQEYLSKREEIIEKTEDACEAGFAYMKELKKKAMRKKENRGEDSDECIESDDVDQLFNNRGGRRREVKGPIIDDGQERLRKDFEEELNNVSSDSEYDSENEPDAQELEAIREYFEMKEKTENGEGSSSSNSRKEEDHHVELNLENNASNADDLPKIEEKTPCEFSPISLDEYNGPEELELLGLEHLKAALTDRGLKCGGSLSERASRLWQIKGLTPREFPKSIVTPDLKRKLMEEEEAERKAIKKAKKSSKNRNS